MGVAEAAALAAAWLAAVVADGELLAVPQAVARMATTPAKAIKARGPDRVLIAINSSLRDPVRSLPRMRPKVVWAPTLEGRNTPVAGRLRACASRRSKRDE